jgi:hypothetical protein
MTLKEKADLAGLLFVGFGLVTAALGIVSWKFGKDYADESGRELLAQRERTARAESSLIELRERTRQRTFTLAQREHLISSLKPIRMGGFEIWGQEGDPESSAFAEQLVGIFGEVGWGMQMMILPDPHAPKGVTVRVHSKDKIPEFAARFVQAAGEIGLPVTISEDPKDQRLSETRVYLIVGSKLPP